jgi:hypothetical protein
MHVPWGLKANADQCAKHPLHAAGELRAEASTFVIEKQMEKREETIPRKFVGSLRILH